MSRRGIPIGNLTSQIFANIYLHEFDRYVAHELHPAACVRYGDDFIIISDDKEMLRAIRSRATSFLHESLGLSLHVRHDILFAVSRGAHFLGMEIFSGKIRLQQRMHKKIARDITLVNASSYWGLLYQMESEKILDIAWLLEKEL